MSKLYQPKGVYKLNRRDFLKLSGVSIAALGLSPLLNACGSLGGAASTGKVGGTIDFLSWEGYDIPTCMEKWNKANEVVLSPSYIGDQSEVQAKLSTASSVGYDLVSYYHGAANTYIKELKLLQPIDLDKVPNFKELIPWFQTGDFWASDGKVWGIPFTWGAEGCCYNADKIDPIESWFDLLKPEFKGKVGLVDDGYGMILMAGIAIGLADKLPNITLKELADVKKFLLELKGQARSIAASYGDQSNMLISGEIVAAFPGWAALNVWAAASGVNVKMNVPKEGGFAFTDAYAIPVGADNVESALAWINEALSPEAQACQATSLAAGVVNLKALPLLDKATTSMYGYDNLDEYFKKVKFYGYPPTTSDQVATFEQWNNTWAEIKAA
jgi:spermidine/putrescine transport system substrate-binding protein